MITADMYIFLAYLQRSRALSWKTTDIIQWYSTLPCLWDTLNRKTKLHEIKHILRRDFDKADCDQVESGVRGA